MRLVAVLVVASSAAAAAPPERWRDTTQLDRLATDIATVTAALRDVVGCAGYGRVAATLAGFDGRLADVVTARAGIVDTAYADWRAAHADGLVRAARVVEQLRTDRSCPATRIEDAAGRLGRAIAVLGDRSLRLRAPGGRCPATDHAPGFDALDAFARTVTLRGTGPDACTLVPNPPVVSGLGGEL